MMMPPLRKKLMFGTIFLGNGVISYSIQNQNDFCCVCNMFELTQDTTTWIHTYTHTYVRCMYSEMEHILCTKPGNEM